MEHVVAFNNELSGLYDSKPPISKGKMAAITKAAMRAIKFYKHVVQSVEKFILKCKPEYKVPGLYVIDSIVRQSRHQFTIEKDVFAPRFARNMKDTFINLFHCPVDDRSRIIRVLNLWQKNNVFQPAVIQPLFDMASELSKLDYQMPSVSLGDISSTSNGLNTSSGQESSTSMGCGGPGGPDENTVAELSIGHHHDQSKLRHLQHIQHLILRQSANESSSTSTGVKLSESVKINKRVLDYDYGDEEDEETIASPNVSNLPDGNNLTQLLKDPNVLRQLQTLQNFQKMKQAQEEKQLKLNEMRLQEEAFEKHLQNVLKGGNSSQQDNSDLASKEVEFISEENKIEVINLDGNDSRSPTPDKDRYKRRRSRSRSRSRDRSGRDRDRRRRSRSRSRSRSPRSSRRRSSRERERERGGGGSDRNREKDREYERERRRKGLPDLKKNHLSVCSTTLWVGHLSKLVHQEELSDTFGKYGEIVSIDMIVPRGCAFIVMHRRQDAYKAMNALKNHKLQSRTITISWAAGKGVKSKEWKDFWDLDLGVTYIPWDKLDKDTDLEFLEDGGMFDEDTLPSWVKEKISQDKTNKDKPPATNVFPPIEVPGIDTSQPPPTGTMMTGVQLVPPQFQIGGVPRLMSGPMGVPLQGIPMPNMVPGMPPHHMMLPPGYPPMPVDKSVPPPNNGGNRPDSVTPNGMGLPPGHFIGMPPLHLGMPPQFGQPPVGFNMPPQSSAPSNDDQMDIEMEVETSPLSIPTKPPPGPPPLNFNQPPPLFPNFPSDLSSGESRRSNAGEEFNVGNRNNRDNRNDRERSRWGGRNDREDSRDRNIRDGPSDVNISGGGNGGDMPWRENSNNFQNNMFVENSRRGGPGNIPPLDLNAPIPGGLGHRAGEFFGRNEDFNDDHRGGPRDFFPNMGNRFGPPGGGNGSIPMSIGPPQFGSRMVGPMFIRGGGGGQGGSGNFNFNENPFDRERDDRGGNRIRGGACDRRGGRGNWRDDDDGLFNRRGNGGRFNNRDRDGLAGGDERRSRDRDRDRNRDRDRGGRDRTSRDRNSRDLQHRNSRNKSVSQTRDDDKSNPTSSPKQSQTPTKTTNNTKNMSPVVDTEEDWDQMLPEHNIDDRQIANERDETSPMLSQLDFQNNLCQENMGTQGAGESNFVAPPPPQRVDQGHFSNTPLYDEPVEAGNPGNITLDSANSDNDNSFTNNNTQQSHSMQEYIDTQHSAQSAEYGNNSPSTSFFEHEEENICSQTDEMPNEE